jgi:MoaA/NifB/PqqE/SkfB family radical SAM enzyme
MFKFGTFNRAFNVFSSLLYAKVFKKRIPVKVALQLTTRCNMRCNYCYVNFDTYKQVGDRSLEDTFRLIDELYSNGTRWIWFLGGEPMMYKEFGKVIDYVQSKGMFCDMNSNGTLINEKNIDVVKKLDGVCISIDGDEETNDYYRGKGTFKRAMDAVKLLRKHGIKVRIHCILTRKTYKTLDYVATMSKDMGITFNYCEVLLNNPDKEEHILTDEESQEFYRKYEDYRRNGYPIIHSLYVIKKMLDWPKKDHSIIYKEEASEYPSMVSCTGGDLNCFYDLDGRVYSCNGTWDDGLNVNEVGFDKAWDYLKNRKCHVCKCVGYIQQNLMSRLDPREFLHGIFEVFRISR